jgi:hypothetical protein
MGQSPPAKKGTLPIEIRHTTYSYIKAKKEALTEFTKRGKERTN